MSDEEKAEMLGEGVTDECGNLLAEWKELMIRFHDRLMFATDAHKDYRWKRYPEIVTTWRQILAQLPADVAEDIAYRNAERVYGAKGSGPR